MGSGLIKATAAAKRTRYPGTPELAVGQVWADCDKRGHGREVKILEIVDGSAKCSATGRIVRIRLDRFVPTSTGYRYVRTEGEHVPRRETGEPSHLGECEQCGMTNVMASEPCSWVEK